MGKRRNIPLVALVIALAAFVLSGKQSVPVANAAPVASYDLLSNLPASDFIIYIDTQRVLTDVVPAILVENPEARAKFESDLEKFKQQVGFDPRLLDGIAVGVKFDSEKIAGSTFSIIARGRFDANATIDAGLAAAIKESRGNLTKRSQEYEGRTLYSLAAGRRATADRDATDESENKLSDRAMVLAALDSNTIAFGNLASVRATIDAALGRGRVDDELVQLATRTPNAAMSFSGNLPADLAKQFRFGNKEADKIIAPIKQVYGSFNTSGNDGEALINVRMNAEEDARHVSMTLNGLKFLAKLGTADASPEAKSIEAMIKNVEIVAVGNEVQISAKMALTDIASFIPRH